MFRHRSRDQNTKFHKFKLSDGRQFENGFNGLSPYLSWESSIFNEIWCADADSRSTNGHMTSYQNLQIQNGGRPPYWKSFMATSQRFIVRLMRNLVWGSTIMFDTGRLTKYQISNILDGGQPPFWKWFYCYVLAANHLISMKFDADANFNIKTRHVIKIKILQILSTALVQWETRNVIFGLHEKREQRRWLRLPSHLMLNCSIAKNTNRNFCLKFFS